MISKDNINDFNIINIVFTRYKNFFKRNSLKALKDEKMT